MQLNGMVLTNLKKALSVHQPYAFDSHQLQRDARDGDRTNYIGDEEQIIAKTASGKRVQKGNLSCS
jgi:hypothetical protein